MNFSIVCSNLSYEIADRKILDKINISFGSGNKYALIGRNGVGKTTFLKILTNNITDYSGNISGTSRHTIGYLPQQAIEIEGNPTVWELALSYLKKALTGWKNYEDILYENLFILGFNSDDLEKRILTFSCGFKMRAVLAGILAGAPDILLMDEPENHIDNKTLTALMQKLKGYKGILLFVAHNKVFINQVATQIVEIEDSNMQLFQGNYDKYLGLKSEMIKREEKDYKKQQEKIKKIQEFVDKNIARAKTSKRAQARAKELKKIDIIEIKKAMSDVSLNFSFVPKQPRILLEMKNIHLSYGSAPVLKDGNLLVERNDKLGFIAPNGAGKTTLINAILEENVVNTNETILNKNAMTIINTFSQESDLSEIEDNTLLEYGNYLFGINGRAVLSKFLFNNDLERKIKVLSGGEKARIILMKLAMTPSNFLILDEPTHHLDTETVVVFKEVLQEFPGSILLVSHNEDLFQGLINKVLMIKNKTLIEYLGDYKYVKEKYLVSSQTVAVRKKPTTTRREIRRKKIFYKQEIKKINEELELLEKKHFELELQLENEKIKEKQNRLKGKKNKVEDEFKKKLRLKISLEGKI